MGPLLADWPPTTRRVASAVVSSNTGFLIQSAFGCCIQASMITTAASVFRLPSKPIMHPMKLSAYGPEQQKSLSAFMSADRSKNGLQCSA